MKRLTGKQLLIAKKRARGLLRIRDKNSKILANDLKNDFLSILPQITKTGSKSTLEAFGIFISNLKKRVQKTLLKNFYKNMEERTDYQFNLWGKKVNDTQIKVIKYKLADKYKANIGKKVSGITENTRSTLEKIITGGRYKGSSYEEIASSLSQKIKDMSITRATTIAKTEINSTSNQVDYDIAEEVEAKTKTWLHVGAGKTDRANHIALDGVTIPFDEQFDLGGEMADCAMDDNLSASEVVNCGCITIYE